MDLCLEMVDVVRKFVDEGAVEETEICEEVVADDDVLFEAEGFGDGAELDGGGFEVVGVFGVGDAEAGVETGEIAAG